MIISNLNGDVLYNSNNIVYVKAAKRKQSDYVYEIVLGSVSGKEYRLGAMDKERACMCAKIIALLMEEEFRNRYAEIYLSSFNYNLSAEKLFLLLKNAEIFASSEIDTKLILDILIENYDIGINSFLVPEYSESAIYYGTCS